MFDSAAPSTRTDRTPGNGLRLFATLLTLLAVSPGANVAGQPVSTDSAPAALAAMAPAVAPAKAQKAAVPAASAPATAVPAKNSRATAVPANSQATAVPAVLARRADGLSPEVLRMALDAVSHARARGVSGRDDLLTIIDYSLASTEPRLWVLDLERGEVLYHELVAHGSGSGDNYATRFSNVNDSKQTSLGLFLTGGTYEGGNGYSLVLKGLDAGFNDRAEARHIVMHGAWYVSREHARSHGRIGRSWGCPALSTASARPVIDLIKGGSFVFSYSNRDEAWLQAAGGGAAAVTTASRAAK